VKNGNRRTVQKLPTAHQKVWVPFSEAFASSPTQLIKVKRIVTTITTLKIFKLNFFMSFGIGIFRVAAMPKLRIVLLHPPKYLEINFMIVVVSNRLHQNINY
jgi:hypothetical protein